MAGKRKSEPNPEPSTVFVASYSLDADGNVWDYGYPQSGRVPVAEVAAVVADLERQGFCVDVR